MSYFPRPGKTNIPEEIFISMLQYLHPGAIWLLCRRVSRNWKVHVDANIERYIKQFASILKYEREKAEEFFESGDRSDHLVQRLQADSLYVEVSWTASPGGEGKTASVCLRVDEVEVPSDESRDLKKKWDEKISFRGEQGNMVLGYGLAIRRIENYMFPGFAPVSPPSSVTSDPLHHGTNSTKYDEYEVTYTISSFPGNGIDETLFGLSIHSIEVPVRSLLLFSTPHVVGTGIIPTETGWRIRRNSPLFNTIQDELQSRPENIQREKFKEEYKRWKMSFKPLCEMCCLDPLDRWCDFLGCSACCARLGGCLGHLIGPRARRRNASKVSEIRMLDFESTSEVEIPWGSTDGQDTWGQDVSVTGFSETNTLVEMGRKQEAWRYENGWAEHQFDILPPPLSVYPLIDAEIRPKSASAVLKVNAFHSCLLRPNSSSL